MDGTGTARPRSLQDLDLSLVDVEAMRRDDVLFLLVCGASFVESGSDTYSRNLVTYFADDPEVGTWLREHWEPEELQHGHALKAYIQRVWPEFEWDRAYAEFFDEYSKLSTAEQLEATRGQEMAGRCIVEMGTTTYYQALSALSHEPVLRDLTWRIRCDEVRHYKHFYAYFLKYREQERLHRLQVLAALFRRVMDIRQNDAGIALRHVARWRLRGHGSPEAIARLIREVFGAMRVNFPVEFAVRLALKPLQLPPGIQRRAQRPLAALTRLAVLR